MRKMTEEELREQEAMDRDVRASTKALFEEILYSLVNQPDEDQRKRMKTLLEVHNNSQDSNARLLGKLRRMENASG